MCSWFVQSNNWTDWPFLIWHNSVNNKSLFIHFLFWIPFNFLHAFSIVIISAATVNIKMVTTHACSQCHIMYAGMFAFAICTFMTILHPLCWHLCVSISLVRHGVQPLWFPQLCCGFYIPPLQTVLSLRSIGNYSWIDYTIFLFPSESDKLKLEFLHRNITLHFPCG